MTDEQKEIYEKMVTLSPEFKNYLPLLINPEEFYQDILEKGIDAIEIFKSHNGEHPDIRHNNGGFSIKFINEKRKEYSIFKVITLKSDISVTVEDFFKIFTDKFDVLSSKDSLDYQKITITKKEKSDESDKFDGIKNEKFLLRRIGNHTFKIYQITKDFQWDNIHKFIQSKTRKFDITYLIDEGDKQFSSHHITHIEK